MKFFGSKSRIAKHIVPIIQKAIDETNATNYVEPFVGGANIIDKIKCENKYGFDINKYIIALHQHVQSGEELLDVVPKYLYNEVRSCLYVEDTTGFQDWIVGNVAQLASYNGRWIDGGYAKAGYEVHGSIIRYRDYYRESVDNLLKQAKSPLYKDIQFSAMDYRDYKPVDGSVIYADPPYQNTKEFMNSRQFDYDEFWNTMREWSKLNTVFISELNAPNDFECIWEQEVLRSVDPSKKHKIKERLYKLK